MTENYSNLLKTQGPINAFSQKLLRSESCQEALFYQTLLKTNQEKEASQSIKNRQRHYLITAFLWI